MRKSHAWAIVLSGLCLLGGAGNVYQSYAQEAKEPTHVALAILAERNFSFSLPSFLRPTWMRSARTRASLPIITRSTRRISEGCSISSAERCWDWRGRQAL